MNWEDRQTDRIVIVAFPAFAGGKFIMNCLALSRHCVPQQTSIARHLIKHPADYNYRFEAVCSTLPPQWDLQNWRQKWEFGDTEFYKGSVRDMLESWINDRPSPVDFLLKDLIERNLCFFMTSHGGWTDVKSLLRVWPHARIILLINYARFWSLAIRLKQKTNANQSYHLRDYAGNECQDSYDLLRGPDWPDWKLFESNNYDIDKTSTYVTLNTDICNEIKQYYGWHENKNNLFCFDVDNNYFHKQKFLLTMKQLYDWMQFDDYNQALVDQYYTKYISLHKEKHG